MKRIGEAVKARREAAHLSQSKLGKSIGTTGQNISKMELGLLNNSLYTWLPKIANKLECDVSEIMPGEPDVSIKLLRKRQTELKAGRAIVGDLHSPVTTGRPVGALARRSEERSGIEIPEIDVRAGAGGGGVAMSDWVPVPGGVEERDGVIAHWNFPEAFLRQELKATPNMTDLTEVMGDSMWPTLCSGDRVFVDRRYTYPSPDGVYVIHDGHGVQVKRIEILRDREGLVVNVISDNERYQPWEMQLGDGHPGRIIGLVVGRITRM